MPSPKSHSSDCIPCAAKKFPVPVKTRVSKKKKKTPYLAIWALVELASV